MIYSGEMASIFVAIVSLLDREADERVRSIHARLESVCGLKAIRLFPYPHFTWIGAEDSALGKLELLVERLAATLPPLKVTTTGLGLFTGKEPVIYIPVVKTLEMVQVHQKLWDATRKDMKQMHPYYAPDRWAPHITLALQDVTENNIGCAMQELSFQSFEMEIKVNNLAVVYQEEGKIGKLGKEYLLMGQPPE
jgi:2'-5' RNA ligase